MAKKDLSSWLKKAFSKYWYVILLLVIYFLRFPSLFEPFTYGDEGIYVTLGQAFRRGLVLYRDIHDNKPPFLYLLAGLAGNFNYFRLILFYWSILTIWVFYRLAEQLFHKTEMAAIVATVIFGLLTSLHTFEGNVANAENFMLLPIIAGVLLILKNLDLSRSLTFFSAGVLFSLAVLFKIPAVFDFAAIVVFLLLIFFEKKKKNYSLSRFHRGASTPTQGRGSGLITNYLLLFLGFLLSILTTALYYAHQGALKQYLTAAFLQNIPYLSSWASGQSRVSGLPLPLLGRGMVVVILTFILFRFRKKTSLAAKLTSIWFAFSWFAALLSSRPYPHYLIQALPALSLSFGLFFTKKTKFLKEKMVPAVLLAVSIVTFAAFRFWRYPNLPYYLNFYQYTVGMKTQEEYLSDFDPQAKTIYQTADYLKTHTLPNEKIFIWGNDPFIYALTNRLPVGRYTVAYHIIDFNGQEETIEVLRQNPPRYLLVTGTEDRPFPELTTFIQNNYLLETRIDSAQIFHREP